MRQTSCFATGKLIRIGYGSAIGWLLFSFPLMAHLQFAQGGQAELAQADTPTETSEPEQSEAQSSLCAVQNTVQQDEQIILGEIPDSPYVVVVPGQEAEQLATVRQCVPDAFQTDSRLGTYIRAGAFSQRRSAEQLSRYLRRLELDARVMYLP